ncbi:MAG: putative lipid II flippase FtsW [Candidatus Falkowbacteria bacterium]|nr:MAG: putative lipid II flippase FtsW [Candidatus Falkowbacteria bacterium]
MKLSALKKRFFSAQSGEHEPDKSLIASVMVLLVFGLVLLFSASSVVSYARFGNTYFYFLNQLTAVAIGLAAFFIVSKIDYRVWRKYAFLFLIFSVVLLTLVFVPGIRSEYGTARSWINLFGHSFQPAELVKLSFLIYLATWLEAKKGDLNSFSDGIVPFLFILGIISLLMLAQPDLGTLFIITFTAMMVFFVGGGKIKHIFLVVVFAGLLLFLMLSMKSSYQSDRFKCLKDPSYSAQDKCYQISQSLIAVGSGGWFGRGLGQSRQKFMYLPEVWGDSIFSIASEEIGFVFSSLLLLLFLFIFYRGLMIAAAAPDLYGQTLATGIVVWLAVQTFLNIGGMINLIPMTGVPLPFVSAGGSAILSALIAMGILVNISKQTRGLKRS